MSRAMISIVVGVHIALVLGACGQVDSDEQPSNGIHVGNISCTDGFEIFGFRDLTHKDYDIASKSKANAIKDNLNLNIYCQKIKYYAAKYCILYLIKDGTPGGDVTYCYNSSGGNLISRKRGYQDEELIVR
jgi:hypothetical protein